jgi:hypothetical protein
MAGPLGWLYDEERELLAIIGARFGQSADVIATKLSEQIRQIGRHFGYELAADILATKLGEQIKLFTSMTCP